MVDGNNYFLVNQLYPGFHAGTRQNRGGINRALILIGSKINIWLRKRAKPLKRAVEALRLRKQPGREQKPAAADYRMKLLLWATAFAVFSGAIGLLQPLDEVVHNFRFAARTVKADGQIVVIGIDEDSVAKLGGKWPWSHKVDARLIDKLTALGVKRIFFDRGLVSEDTPEGDAALIQSLDKARGRIFLGTRVLFGSNSVANGRLLPALRYRNHAEIADYTHWRNNISQVAFMPLATMSNGTVYSSISAYLANTHGNPDQWFRPDFSIDIKSIPYHSAIETLEGNIDTREFAGRDVIIGLAAESLGDTQMVPLQGSQPGVFVHVIAAQTLKRGIPIDIGWLPAFAISLALSSLFLFGRHKWLSWGAIIGECLICGGLPILLDAKLISVDVVPGILLFLIVSVRHTRVQFGLLKSTVNSVSDLPNMAALRNEPATTRDILVAAKVGDFAAISASFSDDIERELVQEIARRLVIGQRTASVYHGDDGTFFWHVPLDKIQEIAAHVEGLRALFASPVMVNGRAVDIVISFGIDTDANRIASARISSALLAAEAAMQSGVAWKANDPNQMFDAEWRFSIGSQLDKAIAENEIWVAYQPKLDLRTNQIIGAEALARWDHPERGAISPDEFITAAEHGHRIAPLTQCVMAQAMAGLAVIQRIQPDFGMAINLAVPLLLDDSLPDRLIQLAVDAGVRTTSLTFEITESIMIDPTDRSRQTLQALRDAGFKVSIDDYGTGYSTLEYLRIVPGNEVKIDRQFTNGLMEGGKDLIMVKSTIEMAHDLGYSVVAEGIECAETQRLLLELGCDVGQGFHIGKPMALDLLAARLGNDGQQRIARQR